ncbi:MAG TPA: hypothetical protein VEG64_03110 [Candidatus Sulfotelmatobacter sp.]|nr:hypothetical protein [Candidatus Sulfotelmatobacter sp.]
MREEGLDERAIAKAYAQVVGNLTGSTDAGKAKLLVDILDKCSKVLEPARPGAHPDSDGPVILQLVHDIPRPARAVAPTT